MPNSVKKSSGKRRKHRRPVFEHLKNRCSKARSRNRKPSAGKKRQID
jgi:hypothetical protein